MEGSSFTVKAVCYKLIATIILTSWVQNISTKVNRGNGVHSPLQKIIDYMGVSHHAPHPAHLPIFLHPPPHPYTHPYKNVHFMFSIYSLEHSHIFSIQVPEGEWVFLCLHLHQKLSAEESLSMSGAGTGLTLPWGMEPALHSLLLLAPALSWVTGWFYLGQLLAWVSILSSLILYNASSFSCRQDNEMRDINER